MIIQFWIWSPKNTRKTPSYPAHFRIAPFGCQRAYCPSSFSLELCLQLCIHKLPKLIALCFLASEFSTSVLSTNVIRRNTHFRLILPRVARPVPTWFSPKPCCPVSPGPQETARTTRLVLTIFDSAWQLSSQRRFSTEQQYQPICTSRHPSSLQSNTCDTSCCVSATAAKSFNSLDNLQAITPDAQLTETVTPEPEAACNSLSLPPPRSHEDTDRRSAVLLADT